MPKKGKKGKKKYASPQMMGKKMNKPVMRKVSKQAKKMMGFV